MTAHDWQPVYPYEANDTVQCARCGVIRTVTRWHKEPFIRYSRPHANINHYNVWRKEEPPCKVQPEPIPDRSAA